MADDLEKLTNEELLSLRKEYWQKYQECLSKSWAEMQKASALYKYRQIEKEFKKRKMDDHPRR